jgi:transcriptional regulator with XRE-family HTH domain
VLLRRVIGDALRARRQSQRRTLREVSTAANVSLGYLSEIERGQKEASSELLSAICEALGSQLSDVLRDVSDTLAVAEQTRGVLSPAERGEPAGAADEPPTASPRPAGATADARRETAGVGSRAGVVHRSTPKPPVHKALAAREVARGGSVTDGQVSVSVLHNGPLRTTLHSTRTVRDSTERDVVCV